MMQLVKQHTGVEVQGLHTRRAKPLVQRDRTTVTFAALDANQFIYAAHTEEGTELRGTWPYCAWDMQVRPCRFDMPSKFCSLDMQHEFNWSKMRNLYFLFSEGSGCDLSCHVPQKLVGTT